MSSYLPIDSRCCLQDAKINICTNVEYQHSDVTYVFLDLLHKCHDLFYMHAHSPKIRPLILSKGF